MVLHYSFVKVNVPMGYLLVLEKLTSSWYCWLLFMFMHFSYVHEALKIFNYEDFKFDQRWVLKYLTYAKESYKANVVVSEGRLV